MNLNLNWQDALVECTGGITVIPTFSKKYHIGALLEYAGAFQLRTTYVLSVSEAYIPDGTPGGFPSAKHKHTHRL